MIVDINPSKIRLITTNKFHKKYAWQIRDEYGADVVINGTLYNYNTWRPVCDVKADGNVLSDDPYAYRGLGWNNDDDHFTVCLTADMPKFDNFISCVFLIYNGAILHTTCTADVKRASGRTAIIGMTDGATKLWCVGEGKKNQTPDQLAASIKSIGDVSWALMLDGGGSSQLSQAGSDYVYSGRKVQNYIAFWNKELEENPLATHENLKVMPYSLSLAGTKKLSSNFAVREFACHDGTDTVFIADELVSILQKIRDHFGKAVSINSGYRTEEWNAKQGGAIHSQHKYGRAADIHIFGVTPQQIAEYAETLMPDWGGIGIYSGFCHVDVRAVKSRWKA